MTLKVKKDDMVMVISGKEKGKTGKVLKVLSKKERLIIEKLNLVKRHKRPDGQYKQGGIIEKEESIPLSNVMVYCEKCTKPIRVKYKKLENESKVRVCPLCTEMLDKK